MFKAGDEHINRQGRPPGSKNIQTQRMREAMAQLIDNNLDNMTLWLAQIAADDPKAAMDIMIRLSERFIPKLSATAITDGDGGDLFKTLTFNFGAPLPEKTEDVDYTELDINKL